MASATALQALAEDEGLFWAVFYDFYEQAQREVPDPSGPNARWTCGGRRVDAYGLFKAVVARGGSQAGSANKTVWWRVAEDLGIPQGLAGTLSLQVRQLYEARLKDLEMSLDGEPASVVSGTDRSLRARKPAPTKTRASNTSSGGASQQTPPPPHPPPSSSSAAQPSSSHPDPSSSLPTTEAMAGITGNRQEPVYTFTVDTPGNRRGVYSAQPEDPSTFPSNVEPALASMIPEKTPRIYNHCVRGLESGIPREVDFALHHLVIISDERGDKFRFSDFPMLAENLAKKVRDVSKVVYGIKWLSNWDLPKRNDDARWPINTLNRAIGTHDLLRRIAKLKVTLADDDLETNEVGNELRLITEASLILRNMAMLEENVKWLEEDVEIVRDAAVIALKLPEMGGRFMEIKNNMLELVEQACPYWEIWDDGDPLYATLVELLNSNDRFQILTSLKCLTMFALDSKGAEKKKLNKIPLPTVDQLMRLYLLVQDPELLSAILDFFYQYTLVGANVIALKNHVHLPTTMIERMKNLLTFDAEEDEVVYTDTPERRAPPPRKIPTPPPDMYLQLMQFSEPERTARWLTCCFIEDEECEVTQLALWHAYQNCFAEVRGPGTHQFSTLQATDFISTVTSTFTGAEAKIVEGPSAKFIIKGIRPLDKFYNLEGYPYHYCEWEINPLTNAHNEDKCNHYYLDPAALRKHVYRDHLGLDASVPGGFNLADRSRPVCCFWQDCEQFRMPTVNLAAVAGHVNLHLPSPQNMKNPPPKPERPIIKPARQRVFEYYSTPLDENNEPVGIAYKALLILRNIQRHMPTTSAGPKYDNLSWTKAMFLSHRTQFIEIADYNPSLRKEIFELVDAIDRS